MSIDHPSHPSCISSLFLPSSIFPSSPLPLLFSSHLISIARPQTALSPQPIHSTELSVADISCIIQALRPVASHGPWILCPADTRPRKLARGNCGNGLRAVASTEGGRVTQWGYPWAHWAALILAECADMSQKGTGVNRWARRLLEVSDRFQNKEDLGFLWAGGPVWGLSLGAARAVFPMGLTGEEGGSYGWSPHWGLGQPVS